MFNRRLNATLEWRAFDSYECPLWVKSGRGKGASGMSAMKHLSIATVTVGIAALVVGPLGLPIGPGLAQGGPEPGQTMSAFGWGSGFMWLMPLIMMAWFALMIAVIVLAVRWLGGGSGGRSASTRTARDILDERYARGEIDRKEYLQRQKDIPGE